MMKGALVIGKGDTQYSDRNRVRLVDCARKAGIDVLEADYHEIKNLGRKPGAQYTAMLFFPFTFWNAHCEIPADTSLYGTSRIAYNLFKAHMEATWKAVGDTFGDSAQYAVNPLCAYQDRDKVETIRMLNAAGVPASQQIEYRSAEDLISQVGEKGIFIKCRYGAEGKGITVLHRDRWVTNYGVSDGKLGNHGVYGVWPFVDITGRKDLLGQLLKFDVIVEREIMAPPIFPGAKFDVRAYVINGKVPHFFVRVNEYSKEITNYSQGAKVLQYPNTGLESHKGLIGEVAIAAAKALGLGFAGVDIMFDGSMGNPRVVEMQAFADYSSVDKFNMPFYIVNESGFFN
jgi:hypothetical protein